jgi:hypothetical protein
MDDRWRWLSCPNPDTDRRRVLLVGTLPASSRSVINLNTPDHQADREKNMDMKRLKLFGIMTSALLLLAGVCKGSVDVNLAWDPSLTDANGQPLAEAPSYKLYVGSSSGAYSQSLEAGSSTSAHVTGLEYNKTYFFMAKAYTANGESMNSEELMWATPVMPDEEADGISDSWEMEHFGALEPAHDQTDYDKDGISDRAEFLAGTSPTDPDEYPALAMQTDTAGATVSFAAKQAVGLGYENRSRYYTLMQCSDLAAGIWTSVLGQENILASNQTVLIEVATSAQSTFYRTDIRLN